MKLSFSFLFVFLLAVLSGNVLAHPVPDVPVRTVFESGEARISVEVDIRCFAEDPESEPYLQNWVLKESTAEEKEEYKRKASELVDSTIRFFLQPVGRVQPEFVFSFTGKNGAKLEKTEDPVVLTGTATLGIPEGSNGYKIEADKSGQFSVVFLNTVDGKEVERIAVLFPGEKSFVLDVTEIDRNDAPDVKKKDSTASNSEESVKPDQGGKWATFVNYIREGFVHVLPLGLDHILFILGIFLFSRSWRNLIWQVTMFTVAHTITLGLASAGKVTVPGSVVEPIIAASIAVIALENIFHPKFSKWRLVVVFVFGLIHGLGFAGALGDLGISRNLFMISLLGFNVGVEVGQLAVVAIAFALTFWMKDAPFRKFVVIPVSILISLFGIWWTFERIFL